MKDKKTISSISKILAQGVVRLHVKELKQGQRNVVGNRPSESFSTGLLNHAEPDCTTSKTSQGLRN